VVPELIAITKRHTTRTCESGDTKCTPEKFGTAARERVLRRGEQTRDWKMQSDVTFDVGSRCVIVGGCALKSRVF